MILTRISIKNKKYLKRTDMKPANMVKYLNQKMEVRTFGDVLRAVYPCENDRELSRVLVDGLAPLGKAKPDSIRRSVSNWLNGANTPNDREELFKICFVLGLDEEKADMLLARASDTAIHYRNPVELVYAFALRTHMGYKDAVELKDSMLNKHNINLEEIKTRENLNITNTYQIRNNFQDVETREDLEKFFKKNISDLQTLHETAYRKFEEYFNLLKERDWVEKSRKEEREDTIYKELADEVKIDKEAFIVNKYLRMGVPLTRDLKDFDLIQKYVKESWPNASSLSEMHTRTRDVTRKTLLLLYMMTGGHDDTKEDPDKYYLIEDVLNNMNEENLKKLAKQYEIDEKEFNGKNAKKDILLIIRLKKTNLFLKDCGMNELDYRNPFDMLLMYSMKNGIEEYADERMKDIVALLYEIINNDKNDNV